MYIYTHATLDHETFKKTGLSSGDKLFAFFRAFYGLKDLSNIFTQQMSVSFRDLIHQGTAPVYIDEI